MGVVLDTSVLIAAERAFERGDGMPWTHLPDEPYIAAIQAGELQAGIVAADSDQRRRVRERFFAWVLESCTVLTFDLKAAEEWAQAFRALRRAGQMIGERDLQIAATALANGHDVLTYNVGEFRRVPGLRVLTVDDEGRVVET